MTLQQIEDALYDDLKVGLNPPVLVRDRFRRWINEAHRRILARPGLTALRVGTLPFSSVADQHTYGFPLAFERVDSCVNLANNIELPVKPLSWMRTVDPGETQSGTPRFCLQLGLIPFLAETATGAVYAVSSDAADTTQTVQVQGIDTNGDPKAASSVTLTGTTRVLVASGLQTMQRWNLSNPASGIVSLYDAAVSGTLLARLPIGSLTTQYEGYRLWPTPGAVESFRLDGLFKIPVLAFGSDIPMIPDSYHDRLLLWCRYRQAERERDNDTMRVALNEWLEFLGHLEYSQNWPANYRPVRASLGGGGTGMNNLGGWYPPDRML